MCTEPVNIMRIEMNSVDAGLTINAGCTTGGSPTPGGSRPTAIFATLFGRPNVEKTFTNHKFRVTFGLNDIGAFSIWSAEGFGEAIELLIARWVKLYWTLAYDFFCFVRTMPAGLHDLHYKRKRKN